MKLLHAGMQDIANSVESITRIPAGEEVHVQFSENQFGTQVFGFDVYYIVTRNECSFVVPVKGLTLALKP